MATDIRRASLTLLPSTEHAQLGVEVHTDGDRVYVLWNGRGPYVVLDPDGDITEQYAPPDWAEELITSAEVDQRVGETEDDIRAAESNAERERITTAVMEWAAKRGAAKEITDELRKVLDQCA